MSKPKLLTKLKIGGDVYKVYWNEGPLNIEDSAVWGYTHTIKHEIHLTSECPPERLREVWLHEIFHAICNSFRINLNDDHEEQLALQFGLGYAQALAGMIEFPEP